MYDFVAAPRLPTGSVSSRGRGKATLHDADRIGLASEATLHEEALITDLLITDY
jgi:hypothetical protein